MKFLFIIVEHKQETSSRFVYNNNCKYSRSKHNCVKIPYLLIIIFLFKFINLLGFVIIVSLP